MYRAPVRPQRSPGAPRPAGSFPSTGSGWRFPGARSPYGGSGYRGGSPRGYGAHSPGSPMCSPGYWDGSPAGFGNGSRGFGGQMRGRGAASHRPQAFSPGSGPRFQAGSSNASVEKYFSPSMLQDPWANLQPCNTTTSTETKQHT